jgi:hypothetical protein
MHASYSKQVAYNQRVLSPEDEIAGINSEAADFLSQMFVDASKPIIICVNAGESFKRHEQHTGGQLWMQADRKMSATNIPFPGMKNDADSACIAGVAEAAEWAHMMEDGPKRTTRRIVIYPPTLTQFSRVLSGDTSNLSEGHEIAYQRISDVFSVYEVPPAFYLDIAEKVPGWMNAAAQTSIGGRRKVLENGADVCNSESDSENDEHGEVLTGMYTNSVPKDANGNPIGAACKLSQEQAHELREQAQAVQKPRAPSPSPVVSAPLRDVLPRRSPLGSLEKRRLPRRPEE